MEQNNFLDNAEILKEPPSPSANISFKRITPESLTHWITFDYGNAGWIYRSVIQSRIPDIQAEGAARLWNMLLEKKIALLSDEVGMGKTIQALAIMATL